MIRVSAANSTSLANGLVGYWPLDGAVTNWTTNTTRDLSGNGNTGQLIGMSTTTSLTIGQTGQALNLKMEPFRTSPHFKLFTVRKHYYFFLGESCRYRPRRDSNVVSPIGTAFFVFVPGVITMLIARSGERDTRNNKWPAKQ